MSSTDRLSELSPWQPSCDGMPLSNIVGEALGSASMCWENVSAAGVFDSSRAQWVYEGLMAQINRRLCPAVSS
jgi:hypothetical protein